MYREGVDSLRRAASHTTSARQLPMRIKASCLQDAIENVCGTFPSSLGHGEFPLLFSVLRTLAVSVLKNKRRRTSDELLCLSANCGRSSWLPFGMSVALAPTDVQEPSMKKRTGRSKGAQTEP